MERLVPKPSPLELVVDPDHPDRYGQYVNVVASYSIVTQRGCPVKLNLTEIAKRARAKYGFYYDSKSLRAIKTSIEVEHPAQQPTVLLFSTGTVNQTGALTEEHAILTAHTLARILTEITGVHLRVNDFRRTNSVANTRLPGPINQAAVLSCLGPARASVAQSNSTSRSSRPFSAVFVQSDRLDKIVYLFYASGAVVIPGAKTDEQVRIAMDEIAEIYQKLGAVVVQSNSLVLSDTDYHELVSQAQEIMLMVSGLNQQQTFRLPLG